MIDAIKYLISDPEQLRRMGKEARRFIMERYSGDIFERMWKIFEGNKNKISEAVLLEP